MPDGIVKAYLTLDKPDLNGEAFEAIMDHLREQRDADIESVKGSATDAETPEQVIPSPGPLAMAGPEFLIQKDGLLGRLMAAVREGRTLTPTTIRYSPARRRCEAVRSFMHVTIRLVPQLLFYFWVRCCCSIFGSVVAVLLLVQLLLFYFWVSCCFAFAGSTWEICELVNRAKDVPWLECGIVDTAGEEGLSPVLLAAAHGQVSSVNALAQLKADLSITTEQGRHILLYVAPRCSGLCVRRYLVTVSWYQAFRRSIWLLRLGMKSVSR